MLFNPGVFNAAVFNVAEGLAPPARQQPAGGSKQHKKYKPPVILIDSSIEDEEEEITLATPKPVPKPAPVERYQPLVYTTHALRLAPSQDFLGDWGRMASHYERTNAARIARSLDDDDEDVLLLL